MKHTNVSPLIFPLATLLFLTAAGLSAADYDYGATFHNSSAMEKQVAGQDAELDQLDSVAGWFEIAAPQPNGGRLSLAGQVAYEYADDRPFLVNLDYFRVYGWMPGALGGNSVLDYTVGRFVFTDPSGYIMNHTADGAKVRLSSPSMVFELSGAYTGLLLNPKSDIRMSAADWSEKEDESNNFFGPRRVVANAAFTFPNLGKLQNLAVYAVGQFDMRPESDQVKINTEYLGLSVSKLYGSNVYGSFFLNAELGQIKNPDADTRMVAGMLLGVNLKYIRADLKGSRFEFLLLAAPPDAATDLISGINVGVVGYLPVSQPSLGINVQPQMNGLGLVELKYSMRPFMDSSDSIASRFQAEVAGRGYFRTWSVGVNWIGTDPGSDSLYLGTEIEAGFTWRILSDVGVGLDSAVFLPASVVSETDKLWTIRMDVSVSL